MASVKPKCILGESPWRTTASATRASSWLHFQSTCDPRRPCYSGGRAATVFSLCRVWKYRVHGDEARRAARGAAGRAAEVAAWEACSARAAGGAAWAACCARRAAEVGAWAACCARAAGGAAWAACCARRAAEVAAWAACSAGRAAEVAAWAACSAGRAAEVAAWAAGSARAAWGAARRAAEVASDAWASRGTASSCPAGIAASWAAKVASDAWASRGAASSCPAGIAWECAARGFRAATVAIVFWAEGSFVQSPCPHGQPPGQQGQDSMGQGRQVFCLQTPQAQLQMVCARKAWAYWQLVLLLHFCSWQAACNKEPKCFVGLSWRSLIAEAAQWAKERGFV